MSQPARESISPLSRELPGPARTGALVALLRLHWFIRLRWVMIFAAMMALLLEQFAWSASVRPGALVAVLLLLAVVNLWWLTISHDLWKRTKAAEGDDDQTIHHAILFVNAQVAIDLLVLTILLRYTGGVENPMVLFYLFHIAISSLVLPAWQAALQTVWAVGLYAAMGITLLNGWLSPRYAFLPALPHTGLQERPEYVLAALVIFACGALGTFYFTLKIAARLDEREYQLRAAHDALLKSEVAIRDLQRRRSRFMQTAAHQLKSPLAGIQTLTGLIRDGVVPTEGIRPTCARIIQRCRDGIGQVTELLTLARIQEADPRRSRTTTADLRDVLREICSRHRPQAKEKQITLTLHLPEDERELRVRADRQDLTDCLGNLVENGIKYTPGPGKVTVVAERCPQEDIAPPPSVPRRGPPPECVRITVADTGMGIEADALAGDDDPNSHGSIFEAFRRGNQALAAGIPGTGLGLSIVREVTEQAGGRMKVQSKVGEGTTFTLMFPTEPAAPDEPATLDTRAREIAVEPRTSRATEDPPATEA